jgi:enoyl-[acyl-carrier-protein] reductase (NADH)
MTHPPLRQARPGMTKKLPRVEFRVVPEDALAVQAMRAAAERQDFAPDSPRGNAICRMVDASEIALVAVFLASDKAWAVYGELVAATRGAGRSVYD